MKACSSWRSPLSLCHSSRSAGRRQQEGSATPPPPPPSRDPCSRRPEIRDPILNRGGASNRDPRISDQISHGQGPTNQPSRRLTATSRQDWIFFFRRRNHQPCNQWELKEQPENLPRPQCSRRRRRLSP